MSAALSHRYGAPVGRYAAAPLTVIGAPPGEVVIGGLGARAEVKAYVSRVDSTADELHRAFKQWLAAKWGDVPPDEQKVPTFDEHAFIVDWPPWYSKWSLWVEELDSFNPLGPTPNEAWLKTEVFDAELEAFRKRFAALAVGTPVKVPDGGKDPGGLHEDPGGIKSPGLLEGLGVTSAIGGLATAAAAIAAAVVVVAVVKR